MKKEVLGWLANNWHWILLVVLVVGFVNQWTRNQNAAEVARVVAERDQLADAKVALEKNVADLTNQQADLQAEVAVKNAELEGVKAAIASLEVQKQEVQLSVRLLNTEGELLDLFKESYPQVARASGLGIIELEDNAVILPYLVVPAWFAETFIIEHNHLGLANEQLAKYAEQEALYGSIITLKDRVYTLEQEKKVAFQDGYDECLVLYNQCSAKYESCLQEPRIDFPNKWGWIGGAVAGTIVGTVGCGVINGNIRF